jgi:hypothetical protein
MDTKPLAKYRRRLVSRIPLRGRWRRQRAIKALVLDGSPEAVCMLAERAVMKGSVI